MLKKILSAVTKMGRTGKPSHEKLVALINDLEPTIVAMTDSEMKLQTLILKEELARTKVITPEITVKAFALCREAAKRVLGQRPYDVQLLAGLAIHDGTIAEMRTGEGKTLVALMPTYLNALMGKGVHVVTVNDYLSLRDAKIVGAVHNFLGLEIGVIQAGMPDFIRKQAYARDVTYGTNSEFGFDYLRDNLRFDKEQLVQRGHHFAIIDEIDSVLIDDARTPLVISGAVTEDLSVYTTFNGIVRTLKLDTDLSINLKENTVIPTEAGIDKVEKKLVELGLIAEGKHLYDTEYTALVHYLNATLKAHHLFTRNKDYMVKAGEVVIVDQSTGRVMDGRRYNGGIHQAIEAKENVDIQDESQTLTSITYQNLFRMYSKLGGMSGTALTEANEFAETYGLEVKVIPTHRPVRRIDDDDEIYANTRSKYLALLRTLQRAKERNQPVLIGTSSVEKSESLAGFLRANGYTEKNFVEMQEGELVFQILNAKNHQREAEIIAQAGMPGAVTIATNMAGRGTDIALGGNAEFRIKTELADMEEGDEKEWAKLEIIASVNAAREKVHESGGLFVIGTERHESRRIDNQLRGRSGRQGDPGRSVFLVSLDDDLIKVYAPKILMNTISKMKLVEGEALVNPMLSKALERAQQQVEGVFYEMRKETLKYDDINNDQRKIMNDLRRELMENADITEFVENYREQAINRAVCERIPEGSYADNWDAAGLTADILDLLHIKAPVEQWRDRDGVTEENVFEALCVIADKQMEQVKSHFEPGIFEYALKRTTLEAFDAVWRAHLANMEQLRNTINLRSMGQRDPVVEYRTEGLAMFTQMINDLEDLVTRNTMAIRYQEPASSEVVEPDHVKEMNSTEETQETTTALAPAANEAHHAEPATAEGEDGLSDRPASAA